MTSYLKIFAAGRTNLKIFPSGVFTPACEIQNTTTRDSSQTVWNLERLVLFDSLKARHLFCMNK